ncbi:acetyltransferase [Colletotrichum orchidophilum]|uniref:N-alpha-acetyltransferase 40 n=1 Tax=Colletotrichum orchidophilum TaxID=1209926 RepID=A0A1G4AZ40_9PEZI|nr:acetyltransferase [Colletotrichum orchidophilum]OHE94414.1 acetyltransferase [Colletotrichum orchidophilum]
MPPRKRRRAPTNPIEAANRKSDADFIRDHLQPSAEDLERAHFSHYDASPEWTSWTHPKSGTSYTLSLKSPSQLSQDELQACFDLIDHTSGADYRASKDGWRPSHKMKEMKSPGLRYILMQKADVSAPEVAAAADGESGEGGSGAEGKICGFTSLMPTFEEGEAVVYCYEIHLLEELRGAGVGRTLMDYLVKVAESIPIIEKVMLTCFIANAEARAFYEKLGFEIDALSPVERKLRFGKVFVPDYVIMSKRVRDKSQAGRGERSE